eukprot:scaffold20728_cov75-Skeletonema_dohrnii-CCMP3373.AAC.2
MNSDVKSCDKWQVEVGELPEQKTLVESKLVLRILGESRYVKCHLQINLQNVTCQVGSGYGPSRPCLREPRAPESRARSRRAGGYLCSVSSEEACWSILKMLECRERA